jgi:hypothetical protein
VRNKIYLSELAQISEMKKLGRCDALATCSNFQEMEGTEKARPQVHKKVVKFSEELRFLVQDGELKKRNAARSRDCSFREEEAILVAAQMLLKTEWCFSIS